MDAVKTALAELAAIEARRTELADPEAAIQGAMRNALVAQATALNMQSTMIEQLAERVTALEHCPAVESDVPTAPVTLFPGSVAKGVHIDYIGGIGGGAAVVTPAESSAEDSAA